ncbi:MAG: sugar transferase EpsL [Desulfuromonadales bacterium]|jgi:sugar transferase EpsL|nr:sugar transferase EpsL [Desulfuromonadales bacterium]
MKRMFDVIVSLSALVLISPLFCLLALAVRINMGCPVFFKQTRPGLHGRPFNLLKFRTMFTAYDEDGKLLPGQKRLTPLGRFMRGLSLDELPQLFNVLKGDMSLVGPRPLLMEYLRLYSPEQRRRHDVRPGITGWAQINGRNALTWEERFSLDVWYVDHQSIWLDIRILWLTFIKVIRREGITTEEGNLAKHFSGTGKDTAEKMVSPDSVSSGKRERMPNHDKLKQED